MTRALAKLPFVLLALGLWILACPASSAGDDDDLHKLNKQPRQLFSQGKIQEALSIAEKAVEVAKRTLGLEHRETATALSNLGLLLVESGDYAKAEPLYQEAIRIYRKVRGEEDRSTAISLNNLALLYWTMGAYAKAEPLFQEALRIRQKILGAENPDTVDREGVPRLQHEWEPDFIRKPASQD